MPWLPPLAAGFVSIVVVATQLGRERALPLQMTGVLLASGVGYALDDPAHEIVGPSPTSLWRRRSHRLIVAVPPAALLFSALLAWHGTAGREETLALTVMFVGLLGLALGIAGVAARRSERGLGGIAAAPALFAALIVSTIFDPRWRPLPMGDIPGGWTPIYLRWSTAAILGILILALSSRDRIASARLVLRRDAPG
jgi:hypothetical protein